MGGKLTAVLSSKNDVTKSDGNWLPQGSVLGPIDVFFDNQDGWWECTFSKFVNDPKWDRDKAANTLDS